MRFVKLISTGLGAALVTSLLFAKDVYTPFFIDHVTADSTKKDSVTYEKFKDLPLKPARKIKLVTTEGTWTSLDISPDGKTIAFDMMGDIFTMPATGGVARQLTKGLPIETHPRFSPDGKRILFTSDRSGSDNLWSIDMEKQDTLQLTKETNMDFPSAAWTPDGEYIVYAKGRRIPKIFMIHKNGGGGTQLVEGPPNMKTIDPAVSADGTCVVGWALVRISRPDGSVGGYQRVIRWTAAQGLQNIGGSTIVDPSNGIVNSGAGRAVNANGSVIVGDGGGICGYSESFRWTQATGTQSLGTFPGNDMCGSHVTVMGLSLDGLVAVGQNNRRAYRWTLGGGMIDLGNLTNHTWRMAFAKSISYDGTTIVGSWGVNAAGHIAQAFRWRDGVGMENLGSLDGLGIEPADGGRISVSADGSVVVGTSYTSEGIVRPFLWTSEIGMVNLQTYLPAIGVDLTGWSLCYATGISADGRTIIGNACMSPASTSGFIITLPAVLPACLTLSGTGDVTTCPGSLARFAVTVTGAGPLAYAWRKDGRRIDAIANPSAATASLELANIQPVDAGSYDCAVTSACGSVTSSSATLTICFADFNCDSTVDFFDYLDFVDAFSSQLPAADFNIDGVIDFFDYLDFVDVFSAGC